MTKPHLTTRAKSRATRSSTANRKRQESKRQHASNPMLAVRVPKALYEQLKARAASDERTLADWLRRYLPNLIDIAAVPDIIANGRMVLKGFDAGVFVRNIDGDHESGWAVKALPYIAALAHLSAGLNAGAQEPTPPESEKQS